MTRTALALAATMIVAAACTEPPVAAADKAAVPRVELVTTMGAMTIELLPVEAPRTVENFLALVDAGFYEGTIFHRVIPNFMIQAGGYDAELNYREPPRTVVNESVGGAPNARWTVAMARHADPDSAATQFFINVNDNKHLDATVDKAGYTVFGKLVAGFEVAENIELTETQVVGDKLSVPQAAVVIRVARRIDEPS